MRWSSPDGGSRFSSSRVSRCRPVSDSSDPVDDDGSEANSGQEVRSFSVEARGDRMMKQPVEQRRGDNGITKNFTPLAKSTISRRSQVA
jgi:hypothetical protein